MRAPGNDQRNGDYPIEDARRLKFLFTASEISTNAAETLTIAQGQNIRHTGTLSVNRILTLPDVWDGTSIIVTRTGGGAGNLDVGGLKTLATGTWARVTKRAGVWTLSAYGAL